MFAADLIVDLLVEIISGAWQSETGGAVGSRRCDNETSVWGTQSLYLSDKLILVPLLHSTLMYSIIRPSSCFSFDKVLVLEPGRRKGNTLYTYIYLSL